MQKHPLANVNRMEEFYITICRLQPNIFRYFFHWISKAGFYKDLLHFFPLRGWEGGDETFPFAIGFEVKIIIIIKWIIFKK